MSRAGISDRTARRGGLALALLTAALSMGASPAKPPKQDAAHAKPEGPPRTVEPLPVRQGLQPLHIIRPLSILQERIAAGSQEAVGRQSAVVDSIARQLKAVDPAVWQDARNRLALIKYTLGGGDPAMLRAVAEQRVFAEAEISLAVGALAYAEGHRDTAAEYLKKVDIGKLGPSLAGHLALVRAVLAAESDAKEALQLTDEARLQSPGTIVEEAALRVAIEIALALADRTRLERSVARYIRRFPRSLYADAVLPRVAAFIGRNDHLAKGDHRIWLDAVAAPMGRDRLLSFYRGVAEAALRAGKLASAASAARRARDTAGDMPLAWPDVYEGAALVVDKSPAPGVERLARAETADILPADGELVAAARTLAAIIEAPPDPAPPVAAAGAGTASGPAAAKAPEAAGPVAPARITLSSATAPAAAVPKRPKAEDDSPVERATAPVMAKASTVMSKLDKILQETAQ